MIGTFVPSEPDSEATKLAQIIVMPLLPARTALADTVAVQTGLQRLVSRYSLAVVTDALRKITAADDTEDTY